MTLDEAIARCEEVADYDCYNENQMKCANEHRQLAEWLRDYKELKMQLSGKDATFDTISRSDAVELVKSFCRVDDDKIEVIAYRLGKLPSAQPERPKGKWIDEAIPNDNGELLVQVCDQCNTFFPLAYTGGGITFALIAEQI